MTSWCVPRLHNIPVYELAGVGKTSRYFSNQDLPLGLEVTPPSTSETR